MTRFFTAFLLAATLPLGAFAANLPNVFSNDDAKSRAEAAWVDKRPSVSKNTPTLSKLPRMKAKTRGQHSLRDPYGDPAFIFRDLHR